MTGENSHQSVMFKLQRGGGGTSFEHVASLSSLEGFNHNYDQNCHNLLKVCFTPVYAVVFMYNKR